MKTIFISLLLLFSVASQSQMVCKADSFRVGYRGDSGMIYTPRIASHKVFTFCGDTLRTNAGQVYKQVGEWRFKNISTRKIFQLYFWFPPEHCPYMNMVLYRNKVELEYQVIVN